MAKLNQKQFAKWCQERYEIATNDETKQFIEDIGDVFLKKADYSELTNEEQESIFRNRMHAVYTDFCKNVLETAEPEFGVKQVIALNKIIKYLRNVIINSNRRRGSTEPPTIIDMRTADAWQMILSRDFWMTLPPSIRDWTQLCHLQMKIDIILNMIRGKMKDSRSALELRRKADEIALRDLMQMGGGL